MKIPFRKTVLNGMNYLPVKKPYELAFTDTLTPSQRNHLRVVLNSPTKLEELRRALGLPARRKPWLEKNGGKRGSGQPPQRQNGNAVMEDVAQKLEMLKASGSDEDWVLPNA